MAATDVVFSGFYFAIGYTVTVTVAGLDCGDYVVSSLAEVTVPINSDKYKQFNGAALAQWDVGPFDKTTYGDSTTAVTMADGVGGIATLYLPVVIGFVYPGMGRTLRPVSEDQTKTQQGPALGMTRRAHWFGALLLNTQGIAFGTNTNVYDLAPLDDGAGNLLEDNELYSGVWAKPIDDNPSFDGMIGWQSLRPFPCTVCAISGFIETTPR